MAVQIFSGLNFTGTDSGPLNIDYPALGGGWNDAICSLKICSGAWQFFEHANYQGRNFQLQPGDYPTLGDVVNHTISSFRQVGQVDSSTPAPSVGGMAQEILNAHNAYRSQVGVPPLTWSDDLASHAQAWASSLAANGSFQHSGTEGEGENLWKGTSGAFSFTQMVGGWGDEKQSYQGGVITNSNYSHYTQMVWRNTTQVGCAGADGVDGQYVLVCRYSPPGNFIGQAPY